MLERAELQKCTCSELSAMCKERGLKHYNGKNRLTKPQMIDSLLSDEGTIDKAVPKTEDSVIDEGKKKYIDNLEVGMLVAFQENKTKINTAAVKSVVRGKDGTISLVRLETQYKKMFHVSPNKIIWVKTNGRWPKAIYMALKGGKGYYGEEKSRNE